VPCVDGCAPRPAEGRSRRSEPKHQKQSFQRFEGVRIGDIAWRHRSPYEVQGHKVRARERTSKDLCLLLLKAKALIEVRLAEHEDDLIIAVSGAFDRASDECGPDALTLLCLEYRHRREG
jgi:hypothetical protein